MDTLLQAIAALAGFAFNASLKASVLVVLVLLAQRLLEGHLSARSRYLLWLAVVASLLTPVGFIARIPGIAMWQGMGDGGTRATPAPFEAGQFDAGMQFIAASGPGVSAALPAQDGWMTLVEALPLVWLCGALVFMGTVAIGQLRFARMVREARPAGPRLQALLQECRGLAGCRRQVEVLCAAGIDAPLVTGCIRPRLLLPIEAGHLERGRVRHVFVHELMHVRNHDVAVNWVLAALQAMHWFNPLVWFGFHRLRLDRELARDAAALQHLSPRDREPYARTLIELSQQGRYRIGAAGALGMVDGHTQLRQRILMITRGPLADRLPALGAGLLLLLGVLAFARPVLDRAGPEWRASAPALTAPRVPSDGGGPVETPVNVVAAVVPAVTQAGDIRAHSPSGEIPTAAPAILPAVQGEGDGLPQEVVMEAATEAEPAVQLALGAMAAPEPEVVAETVPAPEIYRDWRAIQKLAMEAMETRDPTLQSMKKWNDLAVACLPEKGFSRVANLMAHVARNCRELDKVLRSGQVSSYRSSCQGFIRKYNGLARRFARAKASQFTDEEAVRGTMAGSFRILSEICNPAVYRSRYAQLIRVVQLAELGLIPPTINPYWWDPPYVRSAIPFR